MLKRVVSVIKFIAERGLAFRGDNEFFLFRNTTFWVFLNSPVRHFLAQHIETQANCGKGHINYLSSTIMKELVNVVGEQVLGEIIS